MEVDRADLVEAAQRIFDEEVRHRELSRPRRPVRSPIPLEADDQADEEVELDESTADDSAPDWLEDAVEVYSMSAADSNQPSAGALDAREALEAAKIPCYLDRHEETAGEWQYRWRVLVPGIFIHRATSVLDRDIFNEEFESGWKAYMAQLTEAELRTMQPEYAFCGLYDKVERINRAYDEELARRGLKPA